jgi:hypothetical protein
MSNGITSLIDDEPRRARLNMPEVLPLALKSILKDIVGKQFRERLGLESLGSFIGESPITERSMKRSELNALRRATLRAMGGELRSRGTLEYDDYGTTAPGDQYADVGGSDTSALIRKVLDPDFNVKTTLGQASIRRDPDTGEYYVIDQYNFNDRLPETTPLSDVLDIVQLKGDYKDRSGAYGIARSLGEAYGSPPGEGSPVNINIGTLEDLYAESRGEQKDNIFKRGLAALGNMLRRERATSPAQARLLRENIPVAPGVFSMPELRVADTEFDN